MQSAAECCYMSTKLHGVTSQKTVILTIIAERTLNISLFIYIYKQVWPVAGTVYSFGSSGILPKLEGEWEENEYQGTYRINKATEIMCTLFN